MARVDDRRVLSGIVHALRNGGRWVDCPRELYGPKKTFYNRFVRWAERDIWERIFSALAGGEDAPDRLFIDSTCIKVHRCAGGGKGGALARGIGRTKGGRNTKLHAVCDAKGRPLVLLLTLGNVHDCKVAQRCMEALPRAALLRRHVADLEGSTAAHFEKGKGYKVSHFKQVYKAARSGSRAERVTACVEAGPQGTDSCFIVTSLTGGRVRLSFPDDSPQ